MGLKQTHCLTTGLLAACLAADYSSLSSERNDSSYSSSSHTVVKRVEQGLYLCRSGPFAIGVPSMHHLLWVCFMYYLYAGLFYAHIP